MVLGIGMCSCSCRRPKRGEIGFSGDAIQFVFAVCKSTR
jgi:hypothetical protein